MNVKYIAINLNLNVRFLFLCGQWTIRSVPQTISRHCCVEGKRSYVSEPGMNAILVARNWFSCFALFFISRKTE